MPTADNKNVIRMFIEQVLNQGQFEHLDELVVQDFVELDPLPGQSQGRDGLKEVIRQMRVSFPDMHWVIDEMIGETDKVCTGLHGLELNAVRSWVCPPLEDKSPLRAW
jgi:predicted ester cyclase